MRVKMASTRGAARAERQLCQSRRHARIKAAEKTAARRRQRRAIKKERDFRRRTAREVS